MKHEMVCFGLPDGRILAFMDEGGQEFEYVGAVWPGEDGNYYRELIIAHAKGNVNNSPEDWVKWLQQQVEGDNPVYHMSEEEDFQFDWNDLNLCPFVMEVGDE